MHNIVNWALMICPLFNLSIFLVDLTFCAQNTVSSYEILTLTGTQKIRTYYFEMKPSRICIVFCLWYLLVLCENFMMMACTYMCVELGMCKELAARLRSGQTETEAEGRGNCVISLIYCVINFLGVWYMVEEAYEVQPQAQYPPQALNSRIQPPNPNLVRVGAPVDNIGPLDNGRRN